MSGSKDDGKTLADFMPTPAGIKVSADGTVFKAETGQALPKGTTKATQDELVEAIRTVEDPEIPVNLYDLGLIYRIDQNDAGDVDIDMTLTAPGCPVAGEMPGMVASAVTAAPGTGFVTVTLVWDPPWDKSKMSDDARLILGV